MGRHKGGGTVHFVTRNGKGRLQEVDQSAYYAAQADPELVEMMPGHFIKKSTAEKYGLMPPEPQIDFEALAKQAALAIEEASRG